MVADVNISQEKSKAKALFNALIILFAVYMAFFVLSAICFVLLDVSCRAGIIEHRDSLHVNWLKFVTNPFYIFPPPRVPKKIPHPHQRKFRQQPLAQYPLKRPS